MQDPHPAKKARRVATADVQDAASDQQPTTVPLVSLAPSVANDLSTTQLGSLFVNSIGVGTLPLGVTYPDAAAVPDRAAILDLIGQARRACAPRSLFVDTADTYCRDGTDLHSLEKVLGDIQDDANTVIGTKAGMARIGTVSTSWRPGNTSAAGVAASITAACTALGRSTGNDSAPLYLFQLHHCDGPKVTAPGGIEDSLAGVWPSVAAGRVLHVGICNATAAILRRAHAAAAAAGHKLASIQNEYSYWNRDAEVDLPPGSAASSKKGTLRAAADIGVTFIAYAPLGGLQARRGARRIEHDWPAVAAVASSRQRRAEASGSGGGSPCSATAVYLAYLLHRARRVSGPHGRVMMIVGARTAAHAAESVEAAALRLEPAEVDALDKAWPRK